MLSLCLSDFCNGVATDIIEAVSALDDENICPGSQLTTPATDAASGEGWLLVISELSAGAGNFTWF